RGDKCIRFDVGGAPGRNRQENQPAGREKGSAVRDRVPCGHVESRNMGVWISLTLYFLLMLVIVVYAWRKATSSTEGYLLGGRDLGPAVTALSAGASDMSGWLLLGLPGALFAAGLGQAWIGIGLFCGALVNWIVVAPRLRSETERYDNSLTIPEFLSKRFPSKALTLRVVSAVIVVVF